MRKLTTILVLLVSARIALADCTNRVIVNADPIGGKTDTAGYISIALCDLNAAVTKGDPLTISSVKYQVSATVFGVTPVDLANDGIKMLVVDAAAAGPAAEDSASLEQFPDGDVTVAFKSVTLKAKLTNLKSSTNVNLLKWSIGPASASANASNSSSTTAAAADTTGGTTAPVSTTVMRLQAEAEYARNGFFGRVPDLPFRTHATVSIDTTNSPDPKFIDNNEITLGLQSLRRNFAAIKQVHFGIEGRLSKAANHDVHDGSVVATFSAWLPDVPSVTIMSSAPAFIAPPLSIALSYGYANKQTSDATYHGKSGDATATYLLYAFDKYELQTSEKWTLNDLSNRPATVPRTQRLFKVQISYLENPAKGFKVAASYENGSVGPVLTKVKQYFIGVALSKFSFSGGTQ